MSPKTTWIRGCNSLADNWGDECKADPIAPRSSHRCRPHFCHPALYSSINILPNIGGFNPSEKYWSKWESSLNTGEHKTYLKPPPRTRTPSFKKTSLHYKIYISPSSTRNLSVVTLTPFKFQVPPKRGRCLKSQEYNFTHTNFPPNRKNNTSETLNSHPLPSKTSMFCLLYQLPKFIFFKTSSLVKQTFF